VLHRVAEAGSGRAGRLCALWTSKVCPKRCFHLCPRDLSRSYFDVRKDALYAIEKRERRRAARSVLDILFHVCEQWLALCWWFYHGESG